MKIGLFFGSFNPIHNGHLIVAQCIFNRTDLDKIWFVISPQNPYKDYNHLAHEFDRYDMVKEAIKDNLSFDVSDVEFHLPKPNYTCVTLDVLKEKFPSYTFSIIIGEDNLSHFHKWKNAETILENHHIYVYPRPNSVKEIKIPSHTFTKIEAPLIDISASYLREEIKKEHSIEYLVPSSVVSLIKMRKLYC